MGQPSRTNEEMKKRKRDELVEPGENADQLPDKRHLPAIPQLDATRPNIYQLVIGSYHRVLQGIVIKVDSAGRSGETHGQSDIARARQQTVEFITNFLFEAHTASIRSIAVSAPPATNLSADASNLNSSHKVLLATGGADERINLYQLSAAYRPSPAIVEIQPHSQLGAMSLDSAENETASQFPVNKAVGTLLHHQGTITALKFPTRGKLISGATDNTIAVTRTRDWAVLTTMKAPKPRASGRPDGDTAAADSIPAGINALAVHPSAKLMISVGKNERCMRLWNLVTGKKAGALMFDSKILSKVGNSRWERAEAKKVEWSATGQEFCILFERAAVVYGEDCKVRTMIKPQPSSKLHQIHYLPNTSSFKDTDSSQLVAISTEDGRLLIYSTKPGKDYDDDLIPSASLVGQLKNPRHTNLCIRIKEFCSLKTNSEDYIVITASSDGVVDVWALDQHELKGRTEILPDDTGECSSTNGDEVKSTSGVPPTVSTEQSTLQHVSDIGRLIGTHEAGGRVTCIEVFQMSIEHNASTLFP